MCSASAIRAATDSCSPRASEIVCSLDAISWSSPASAVAAAVRPDTSSAWDAARAAVSCLEPVALELQTDALLGGSGRRTLRCLTRREFGFGRCDGQARGAGRGIGELLLRVSQCGRRLGIGRDRGSPRGLRLDDELIGDRIVAARRRRRMLA